MVLVQDTFDTTSTDVMISGVAGKIIKIYAIHVTNNNTSDFARVRVLDFKAPVLDLYGSSIATIFIREKGSFSHNDNDTGVPIFITRVAAGFAINSLSNSSRISGFIIYEQVDE